MPLHNIQGRSLHSIGFQLKARGHLRKDDCPHQHPHKIHKLESMSFLGKFGIGSMNLRRRKPRRCFPLTLGPLDPGSLGNDGEVGLPCPPLSFHPIILFPRLHPNFRTMFSSLLRTMSLTAMNYLVRGFNTWRGCRRYDYVSFRNCDPRV